MKLHEKYFFIGAMLGSTWASIVWGGVGYWVGWF